MINNRMIKGFVDTGASISLLSHTLLSDSTHTLTKYNGVVKDASGNKMPILGKMQVRIMTPNGTTMNKNVLVFKKDYTVEYELLIGMNISQHSQLNFQDNTISFNCDNVTENKGNNDLKIQIMENYFHEK